MKCEVTIRIHIKNLPNYINLKFLESLIPKIPTREYDFVQEGLHNPKL